MGGRLGRPYFIIRGPIMKHYIIPIFIPHYGCHHQCVFCNQKRITGIDTPVTPLNVARIIDKHLSMINQPRHIEVAFYGGSFTALATDVQQTLLFPAYIALKEKRIHAIRLSTRPDCITQDILSLVSSMGVSTIELGAQSLDDHVLKAAARGHSSSDVTNAVSLIKTAGINCGLQFMVGLPKENWSRLINTTYQAIALRPDFTRIYPTLVIADTHLATLYKKGSYKALTLYQAIARSAFMKLTFERSGIPVIRTGLQASEDLACSDVVLAGPYHPSFGEMVDSHLFNTMVVDCLDNCSELDQGVIIHHHVKDTSKVRGLANSNLKRWQRYYKAIDIKLVADGTQVGEIKIDSGNLCYTLKKSMLNC